MAIHVVDIPNQRARFATYMLVSITLDSRVATCVVAAFILRVQATIASSILRARAATHGSESDYETRWLYYYTSTCYKRFCNNCCVYARRALVEMRATMRRDGFTITSQPVIIDSATKAASMRGKRSWGWL